MKMENRQLKTQRQKSLSDKVRLRKANSLAELFAPAEINAIIEELIGKRENITDLIVFYRTGDNFYHSRHNDLPLVKLLGLVEFCKNMELNPQDDED
jgi:hypothetical protein